MTTPISSALIPAQQNLDANASVSAQSDVQTQSTSSPTSLPKGLSSLDTMSGYNPSQQVRGNVLNTTPPVVGTTQTAKSSDLTSAQKKLSDLNNFAHPTNAALIAAMEAGIGSSSTGSNVSGAQGMPVQQSLSSAATADLDAPTANQEASTQAGENLRNAAETAAKTDDSKKCHNHNASQNALAEQLSGTMGVSGKDAKNLLKAIAHESNQSGFTANSPEGFVVASAMATLGQLHAEGKDNSAEARALKSELLGVSQNQEKAGSVKNGSQAKAVAQDLDDSVGTLSKTLGLSQPGVSGSADSSPTATAAGLAAAATAANAGAMAKTAANNAAAGVSMTPNASAGAQVAGLLGDAAAAGTGAGAKAASAASAVSALPNPSPSADGALAANLLADATAASAAHAQPAASAVSALPNPSPSADGALAANLLADATAASAAQAQPAATSATSPTQKA